jgi:nucleotide-binding universal stress UspA family protein
MKTILIGVDGSPSADAALDFAIELCQDTGATLEVLAVRPHLPVRGGGVAILEIESPEGARSIARRSADRALAAGVRSDAHVAHGSPAESIAESAGGLGADLIVVGSRGLGTVSAVLMGSVSRWLVRHADIPVTIVSTHHDREPAAV